MGNKVRISRELNLKDASESNIFLRKLWSSFEELLSENGGNGWQYMPTELDEGTFLIGRCNIGEVQVQFGKTGGIKTVIIECDEKDEGGVRKCIDSADSEKIKPKTYCCVFHCKSFDRMPIVQAAEGNVAIVNSGGDYNIRISINVEAFCKKDALFVLKNMLPHVSSLLFVYYKDNIEICEVRITNEPLFEEIDHHGAVIQEEWYDGDKVPRNEKNEYIVQYQFAKALSELESIVWDKKHDIYPLLNCARNVKLANDELKLLYERGLGDFADYTLLSEYINGIIMSALEGLATKNSSPAKCEECGQLIYSISKNVKDYVEKNMNEMVAAKALHLYNKRSKLFHKNRNNLYEYAGTSWPLLLTLKEDKKEEAIKYGNILIKNRFISYFNIGDNVNFIDYVNYLIRKELDETMKNQ